MGNKYDDIFHNAYWDPSLGDNASDEQRTQHAYDVMGSAWNADQGAQKQSDDGFKALGDFLNKFNLAKTEKAYADEPDEDTIPEPKTTTEEEDIDEEQTLRENAPQISSEATPGVPKRNDIKGLNLDNIKDPEHFSEKWKAIKTLGTLDKLEQLGLADEADKMQFGAGEEGSQFTLDNYFLNGWGQDFYDKDTNQITGSLDDVISARGLNADDIKGKIKEIYGRDITDMNDLMQTISNQTTSEMSKARNGKDGNTYDDLTRSYLENEDNYASREDLSPVLKEKLYKAQDDIVGKISISPKDIHDFRDFVSRDQSGFNTGKDYMHLRNIDENSASAYESQLRQAAQARANSGLLGRDANDLAIFAELQNINDNGVGGKTWEEFRNKGPIDITSVFNSDPSRITNIVGNNKLDSDNLSQILAHDYNWMPTSNSEEASKDLFDLIGSEYMQSLAKEGKKPMDITKVNTSNGEVNKIQEEVNAYKDRNAEMLRQLFALSNPNLQNNILQDESGRLYAENPYSNQYIVDLPNTFMYDSAAEPENFNFANMSDYIKDNTAKKTSPSWDADYLQKLYARLKKRG